MKGNREFAIHLGETDIPIGETELIRVLAMAMSSELGGARWI